MKTTKQNPNTDFSATPTAPFAKLSNRELIDLCKKYGKNARLWMRKFADLLPEVEKRRLYKRHGCCSIYEFAAKFAGMNHDTTCQVLTLCKNLKDKSGLRGLLVEQGWSKLRVVASIATPGTAEFWAEKVKTLTKGALELYVRDWKERNESKEEKEKREAKENLKIFSTQNLISQQSTLNVNTFPWESSQPAKCAENCICELTPGQESEQNGLPGPGIPHDNRETLSFKINPKTKLRLLKLKQKLEKKKKEPLTYDQVLSVMLDQIENQEEPKKVQSKTRKKLSQGAPITPPAKSEAAQYKPYASRKAPAKTLHETEEKHQGCCAFSGCNKPAEHHHHPKRYGLYKNHDRIVPLCKHHHDLAHAGLIENEHDPAHLWRLRDEAPWWDENNLIDKKVQEYKQVGQLQLAGT